MRLTCVSQVLLLYLIRNHDNICLQDVVLRCSSVISIPFRSLHPAFCGVISWAQHFLDRDTALLRSIYWLSRVKCHLNVQNVILIKLIYHMV
jgi:hypothetical protein